MRVHAGPGMWFRLIACVTALTTCSVLVQAAIDAVRTDSGLDTTGPATDGVAAFLGVPFAAPPIGSYRWRPPQPPVYRNGDWKADSFATSCMQSQPGSRLPWTEEFMTQGAIGEDCLY